MDRLRTKVGGAAIRDSATRLKWTTRDSAARRLGPHPCRGPKAVQAAASRARRGLSLINSSVPRRLKFLGELLDNAYESTQKLVACLCLLKQQNGCSCPLCLWAQDVCLGLKMCSLCSLCCVVLALCLAWPCQVRLTPSDPMNYLIAKSPNRRGAHFDQIANREALPRYSAQLRQPWLLQTPCSVCVSSFLDAIRWFNFIKIKIGSAQKFSSSINF